jgi:glycosyltransferase involved in cell wall biosynthesis
MRVVAVVPALDAAGTIEEVVTRTREVLPDVVVVDDGSRDATAEVAAKAGAAVLRIPRNRGKGAALKLGFAHAVGKGYESVVTLDADGQHDPGQIGALLRRKEETGAMLVIGERTYRDDEMIRLRRFGNRFSRRAVSFFAGVRVPDPQSGFRVYDRKLLEALSLRGDGYELESEVIVRAARAGLAIESVPITLLVAEGTKTSHFRPWADTTRICIAVVRTRLLG